MQRRTGLGSEGRDTTTGFLKLRLHLTVVIKRQAERSLIWHIMCHIFFRTIDTSVVFMLKPITTLFGGRHATAI